jgi:hypothetical protein
MIAYKRKTIGRQVRMLGNLCLHFNSTYIICRPYDFFRLNRMYMGGVNQEYDGLTVGTSPDVLDK